MASGRNLKRLLRIEQDRDGTVVSQFNGHVSLKNSRFNLDAESLEGVNEFLVEFFAFVGRRSLNETRASAAASVTVESELRDGEDRAARIGKREIHLAVFIVEDSEVHDSFRERSRGRGRVLTSDGDENEKARSDFTGYVIFDDNARAGNALKNGSHGRDLTLFRTGCVEQRRAHTMSVGQL